MNGMHAIVLAAGAGSRFGGGKLMVPWRGGVLLDGALAVACACDADTVRVVVGADLRVAPYVASRGLQSIVAADAALGLSASLKAGVLSLPPAARGVIVFLGDMPLIPLDLPRRLIEPLIAGAVAAGPVFEGRLGHPVAFSASLFPQIAALTGDQGGRAILKGLGDSLVVVNSRDKNILFDVDLPADIPHPLSTGGPD